MHLLGEIDRALLGLKFGEVIITVRDQQIVQIERISRARRLKPKERDHHGHERTEKRAE